MSFVALQTAPADFGEMLVALAASEGSASHPYTHSYDLNADPLATRLPQRAPRVGGPVDAFVPVVVGQPVGEHDEQSA